MLSAGSLAAADQGWWGPEPDAIAAPRAEHSAWQRNDAWEAPADDWRGGLRPVSHAERSRAGSPVQSAVSATAAFEVNDGPARVSREATTSPPSLLDEVATPFTGLQLDAADPARRRGTNEVWAQRQTESARELRPIGEILPYMDYEPGPDTFFDDTTQDPSAGLEEEYQYPEAVPLPRGVYLGRAFGASLYAWEAPNLAYHPLYFEDVPLERYGHTYPCYIQPAVSVVKFTQQLVWWPYHATLDPPDKCIYPLGYYRPGECAPRLFHTPPLNAHAGLVQAGVTTGLFYIFP